MRVYFLFIQFILFAGIASGQHSGDYYLLIGTYTTTPFDGIEVYDYNSANGQFRYLSKTATKNPSYLAISPDKKYIYAVTEAGQPNGGGVVAYSFDMQNGWLSAINHQTSMGNSTCYVSVHSSGKYVAAGNYSSGNLVYYSTNPDGSLNPPMNIKHEGSGPVKGRQDGPHVHATVFSPDHKYLLVPDLGIDKVMIYPLDVKGNIQATKANFVKLAPGAGPRHIDFHPNGKWAYLIEELSGNMTALSYAKGKLTVLNSVNGYPADYKGPYGSADVHVSPDGKFVYGSNRGESNTIGIFKIDPKNGKVSLIATQSVLGLTPRNFNFDPAGNKLLVANQNSNEVVVFDINHESGLLTDTGTRLSVSKPVCLKWVKK
jgi:6-phosphogluconolactonase